MNEAEKKVPSEEEKQAADASMEELTLNNEDTYLFQSDDTIAALKDQHAKEVDELKNNYLRALADVENARERHKREVQEAKLFASTAFARDLLESVDNLRRALSVVPDDERKNNKALDDLVTGVELTEKSLLSAFERHQIKRVEPKKGEKFSHKLHQAMFEVPTNEIAPGHIAEVMQVGYVLGERLLRPALVGVSKKAAANPVQADTAASADQNPDPV